jgi:hypothetical protein
VGDTMTMSKSMHDSLYAQIVERDGTDICSRCGTEKPKDGQHEIHHYNGDDTENNLANVCLLCHGCNHLKKLQKKVLLPKNDYSYQLSAAHKKNIEKEPLFKKWLSGVVEANNFHYPVNFVIKEGAYYCDISPETARRYLSKLCDHPTSVYVTEAGTKGVQEIWLTGKEPSRVGY